MQQEANPTKCQKQGKPSGAAGKRVGLEHIGSAIGDNRRMSRSVQSAEPDLKHKIGSVLQAIYLSLFVATFGSTLLSILSPEIFAGLEAPIEQGLRKIFPSVDPNKWGYVVFAVMFILVAVQTTLFPTRKQTEATDARKALRAALDELERAGLGKSEAAKDLERKLRALDPH